MAPSGEPRIQRVAFIRHGVAMHNLLDPITHQPPNLTDESLFDPPLVFRGKQQALEAGERTKIWWKTTQLGEDIEFIVTSPLTRCIQTTTLCFLAGDAYTTNERSPKLEPKIYCTDLVREAFGQHYPDKRRNKSVLKKHWPNIEFSRQMTENDDAWSTSRRETIVDIQYRISLFLQELTTRPENNVVVVSHGVWIECCLRAHCPEALGHGTKRVHNCNVFVGDCVSQNGEFVCLQNMQQIH